MWSKMQIWIKNREETLKAIDTELGGYEYNIFKR
jgi:hypothetical protein